MGREAEGTPRSDRELHDSDECERAETGKNDQVERQPKETPGKAGVECPRAQDSEPEEDGGVVEKSQDSHWKVGGIRGMPFDQFGEGGSFGRCGSFRDSGTGGEEAPAAVEDLVAGATGPAGPGQRAGRFLSGVVHQRERGGKRSSGQGGEE